MSCMLNKSKRMQNRPCRLPARVRGCDLHHRCRSPHHRWGRRLPSSHHGGGGPASLGPRRKAPGQPAWSGLRSGVRSGTESADLTASLCPRSSAAHKQHRAGRNALGGARHREPIGTFPRTRWRAPHGGARLTAPTSRRGRYGQVCRREPLLRSRTAACARARCARANRCRRCKPWHQPGGDQCLMSVTAARRSVSPNCARAGRAGRRAAASAGSECSAGRRLEPSVPERAAGSA
jgi:hypothetical protein